MGAFIVSGSACYYIIKHRRRKTNITAASGSEMSGAPESIAVGETVVGGRFRYPVDAGQDAEFRGARKLYKIWNYT